MSDAKEEHAVRLLVDEAPGKPTAPQPAPEVAMFHGVPLKHFVLVLLTLQNAGAVLLMRYTRSIPGEAEFVTQTAVIMQEVLKGLMCVAILLKTEGTVGSAWAVPTEALKTAIPAILYLGQNNLQYIAVGLLDAATYTVTYQTKTIWSGIFSYYLLQRAMKLQKWCGLGLLSLGVALVQFSSLGDKTAQVNDDKDEGRAAQRFTGFMILLLAAALSSMAGVYFEKILKGVKVSLWTRNLQLAVFSCIAAVAPLFFSADSGTIQLRGFFYGYTSMTWVCICMNAGGGLLVGAVINYADAVTKDFAIGSSIVLSSLASTQLFGFEITPLFFMGGTLVIYAVFLYAERATCGGYFKP